MASNSKLRDVAKRYLPYNKGDVVVLSHRRLDGYPQSLEFGVDYYVESVDHDFVNVRVHSGDGIGWMPHIKINQIYILPKAAYRDIKIESVLK